MRNAHPRAARFTRAAAFPLALPLLAALSVSAAGCGPGGGGGRSSPGASGGFTTTPPGPGTTPSTTSASQAHWQVALAALGQNAAPRESLSTDAAGIARWNELIARGWPGARGMIDARLELELRKALGAVGAQTQGQSFAFSIQGIRNLVIDTAAPPAITGGGAGTALRVGVGAPGAGTWRVACTADVVAQLNLNVGGVPFQPTVAVDVSVEIADIRLSGTAAVDATRPERPMLVGAAGAPQVSLRLTLASQDPWASQVLGPLTQVLDPVLRIALVAGGIYVQQQAGALVAGALPAVTWGSPAPSPAPLPAGVLPLGPEADRISDEIERLHTPFGTLLPAGFDQPGYGNGNLVRYYDYGDSADWTGHYLAAEAMRYELTGDPRALARADRVSRGIMACLEVAGGDLLSRCAVPMSSPFVADIAHHSDFFVGSVGGVPTGATGDVSRDSYMGTFFGMSQAWLRVPALRARAADYISRNIAYLVAHDWNPTMARSPQLSRASPMSQTPGVIHFLLKCANAVDRARWGALHDYNADLARILWINVWLSSREVHESYYKFQIAGDEIFASTALETDPARYREYVKELVILEDAIGFHENAYYDAVCGAVIPAAAPAKAPALEDALLRWTARPKRAFPIDRTGDPTIPKAPYAPPSFNAQGLVTTGPAQPYALHPLPVELRVSGDFLWIKDPFELKHWDDPLKQYPGLDLILPYWMGRSYGMLR